MEDFDLLDLDGRNRFANLRLPTFWEDKPASWFALAESRFRLNGVGDEQVRFDLLVNSLNKESVGRVLDIVENPPQQQPYSALKARLLAAHQLTDYQKIAQLHKMESLGGRTPSQLLAAMLELCPRGQEGNMFFTHLFLERLPAELRIMLGEDDHQDPRPLAEKADKLWALHGAKLGHIAAVDGNAAEPAQVAAVASRGGQRGRGGGRGRGGFSRGRGGGGASSAAQSAPSTNPVDLARLESGLCFFHWSFGDKAQKCSTPCSWGN
jgi:hypothetical protein